MKRIFTSIAMAALISSAAFAVNTTTTVSQVTEAVTISTDVDYVITSDTPFAEGSSINIDNTEHAVVIIKNVKPSLVLSQKLLDHIYIKGEKAVDGSNCQVRLYTYGTIILPYDKNIKPLTVFSEQNCTGESCDAFGLEHSGGYMNTMNASKLNNRVRSFTLKRGYMVTFAIGTGGWGYSRCFIADTEDLVVNQLPNVLDQRISSYRIFKWVYAQKKGLASDANAGRNAQLGSCWTYDWAQGNESLLPDVEWVPNHIYEDWPSSSSIGSRNGTCHTKNNNEPANSSDYHPQSVETVLNNWQNMMRTGLRLCSPATHDGGWGWHNEFMNEIDKRGWRCDVVDFHGYWNSGTWNSLDWMIDTYAHGRPVWFSEWVWGSSWGNQGIFGECPDGRDSFSQANQQKCYDGTKPILERLEANDRVERYAYWNGEAVCSRILHDGQLSILGRYYANIKSAMAYRKAKEFVPKTPTVIAVSDFACNYASKTHTATFTWTEPNGDLVGSITLQRKAPGGTWSDIRSFAPKDQSSKEGVKYTAADTLKGAEPGEYEYRVKAVSYAGKSLTSNTASVSISSQQSAADFIFGSAKVPQPLDMTSNTTINNTAATVLFEGFDTNPYAFIGLPSNKNPKVGVTTFLNSASKTTLKFGALPWTNGYTATYSATETMDYVAIPEGVYHYDDMQVIVGRATNVNNTVTEVTFPTPFMDGDSVVVICQPYMTTAKIGTVPRVTDVTTTGFKLRHVGQQGVNVSKKSIYYIAASKGQAKLGGGYIINVGTSDQRIGGTATYTMALDRYTNDEEGILRHDTLMLANPVILCGPQTDCLPEVASIFRINSSKTEKITAPDGNTYTCTYALGIRRQLDASFTDKITNNAAVNGDTMGWICISMDIMNAGDENGITQTYNTDRTDIYYTASGIRINGKPSQRGIYIHGNRKVCIP